LRDKELTCGASAAMLDAREEVVFHWAKVSSRSISQFTRSKMRVPAREGDLVVESMPEFAEVFVAGVAEGETAYERSSQQEVFEAELLVEGLDCVSASLRVGAGDDDRVALERVLQVYSLMRMERGDVAWL